MKLTRPIHCSQRDGGVTIADEPVTIGWHGCRLPEPPAAVVIGARTGASVQRLFGVIPAKERVKKSKLQASERLRSVIPAKAGIHLSSWNKL